MMYCDNYCPIDYNRLCREFDQNDAVIQITAYSNEDGYTKSNLGLSSNGLVEVYDKKRITANLKSVDIGYAIVNRDVVEVFPDKNENFEKIAYPELVNKGKLFATVTEHRYYSVGSWKRISLTEEFF